jgi:hypothetical protein
MAREITHERKLWKGEVVTVLGKSGRKTSIRDTYGFTHEVPSRELKALREDDPRRAFKTVEDGNA